MSTPDTADLDDFDDLLSDDTPEQGSAWEVGEVITCLTSGSTQNFGKPLVT